MKTFAEVGWSEWTGVLMIYGYGIFIAYLRNQWIAYCEKYGKRLSLKQWVTRSYV